MKIEKKNVEGERNRYASKQVRGGRRGKDNALSNGVRQVSTFEVTQCFEATDLGRKRQPSEELANYNDSSVDEDLDIAPDFAAG